MTLTAERKKEIKKLADDTRVKYQENKLPPYNPSQIAAKMGLKVLFANFKTESISAALFVDKGLSKKGAEIYIKATDNPLRQNFSIAHEIGHYLLHKKTFIDEPDQFWRSEAQKSSKEEQEANFFAAELLMPEETFKNRWSETKGQPEDLSKEFAVSVAAVLFRARDIKLF